MELIPSSTDSLELNFLVFKTDYEGSAVKGLQILYKRDPVHFLKRKAQHKANNFFIAINMA